MILSETSISKISKNVLLVLLLSIFFTQFASAKGDEQQLFLITSPAQTTDGSNSYTLQMCGVKSNYNIKGQLTTPDVSCLSLLNISSTSQKTISQKQHNALITVLKETNQVSLYNEKILSLDNIKDWYSESSPFLPWAGCFLGAFIGNTRGPSHLKTAVGCLVGSAFAQSAGYSNYLLNIRKTKKSLNSIKSTVYLYDNSLDELDNGAKDDASLELAITLAADNVLSILYLNSDVNN
ncbi:MAG: hypothetical protein HOO06_14070 [Bdellovibrionaceae bacterium]|nr:hypothetical protein [Pseudobdellovibrionaceae bacterium]